LYDRKGNETFQKFVERIGKVEVRRMIENLMQVPYTKRIDRFTRLGRPA
jgi:hypothetical protein